MIPGQEPEHDSTTRATSASGVMESIPAGSGASSYARGDAAAARSTARSPSARSPSATTAAAPREPQSMRGDVMRERTGSTNARQLLAQLPELAACLHVVRLRVRSPWSHLIEVLSGAYVGARDEVHQRVGAFVDGRLR